MLGGGDDQALQLCAIKGGIDIIDKVGIDMRLFQNRIQIVSLALRAFKKASEKSTGQGLLAPFDGPSDMAEDKLKGRIDALFGIVAMTPLLGRVIPPS